MILRSPTSTLFPYTTLFRSAFLHAYPIFVGRALFIHVCYPITAGFLVSFQLHTQMSGGRGGFAPLCRWRRSAGMRSIQLRSEEHTSELQSLTNLVCRLLLEK